MPLSQDRSISIAKEILRRLTSRPDHVFWPDDVSYLDLPERGLRGRKQITDYYLVALATARKGKVATLDEALAAVYHDVCVRV